MVVSFLPFPTRLLGEHIGADEPDRVAVVIYGLNLLLARRWYLGSSTKLENAIADFAETYADQNGRDHAALAAAVTAGRVQAQSGMQSAAPLPVLMSVRRASAGRRSGRRCETPSRSARSVSAG